MTSDASWGRRWRSVFGVLWGLTVAAVACAPPPRPAPRLFEVSPPQVSRRLDATVALLGQDLLATTQVAIDRGRAPTIDANFEVYLGGLPLPSERIRWVDPTRIDVTIVAATPAAHYDLRVVLPDGRSAELPTALEVSDEPHGLNVSIEDQPAGVGVAIGRLPLTAGSELPLFAVLRDDSGAFAGDVSVTWQLESELGRVEPGPASSSALYAERVGEEHVVAQHPVARDGRAGPIEILGAKPATGAAGSDAGAGGTLGEAVGVYLETAPGGAGAVAADVALTTDETLRLFAVARDAAGRFVADATGLFSFSGSLANWVPLEGSTFVGELSLPGPGRVRFEHDTLGAAEVALGVAAGRAVQLSVAPDELTVNADNTEVQFAVVEAVDADGNQTLDTGELVWSLVGGSLSAIDPASGLLLPVTAGAGRVRVDSSYGVFDETGVVAISPGRLATLLVDLPVLSLTTDDAAFTPSVEGRDADGNLTSDFGTLTWSVASGSIGNLDADSGRFDPARVGVGTLRLQSSLGPEAESLALTVLAGRATTLAVSPQSVTLSADDSPVDFVATGTDADGNATLDLGELSWSIDSGAIASLASNSGRFDPTTPGLGAVRVASSYGPTQVAGPVVVAPGRAASLAVQPDSVTVIAGGASVVFSALAYDADGNLTGDVGALAWSVGEGDIGGLDAALGVLNPTVPGSGRVRVESSYGPSALSGTVEIQASTVALGADLLGDGTPAAQMLDFDGQLLLGPSADGARFVQSADLLGPWVDAPLSLGSLSSASNSAGPVFPTIGSVGCVPNTLACGPDNEDGRGVAVAGALAGSDWLALAGGRSTGNMAFVYLAPAGGAGLDFRPVDIGDALGGQTRGVSAMHFFGDRLYLGFADTGGNRPFFLVLLAAPPPGGLDASEGNDVLNLEGRDFPGFDTSGHAMIDVIADFQGRLYVANAGGWIRSTTPFPGPYDDSPADWANTLPAAPQYAAHASVTTLATTDIKPAARAVPAMVQFGSLFYAARNTVAGPQLWLCNPSTTGGPACDPQDWQLCAPNGSGDTALTQFDNPNNTALSLLVASGSALYLGYDNAADGVVVFRTVVAGACAASDFVGAAGCPASSSPSGCSGVGSNGFGDGVTRVFDAKAVSIGGGTEVLVTAGDGTGPVRAYWLNL